MAKRKRMRRGSERDTHNRYETLGEREAMSERVPPVRRTRRWLRRFAVLTLLLLGLLAALPTIVGTTMLRNTLLAKAAPAGWRIKSEQASLGWMGNQTLGGVSVTDESGNLLLTVESISMPRSLVSLLMNQSDLGKIVLTRPIAYVETKPGGSNWEDFYAALQQQSEQRPEPNQDKSERVATRLGLEVTEGTVQGTDATTGRRWLLENVNVAVAVDELTEVQGNAQLVAEGAPRPGHVKFHWRSGEEQSETAGQQHLELLAQQLPLEPLEPWLVRVLPEAQLKGTLSVDSQTLWSVDAQRGLQLQTAGRLEAEQFDLTGAALQGDRLSSQKVNAPWRLSYANEQLAIEQLRVETDWAQLDAVGEITVMELKKLSFERLPQRPAKLLGRVDLAKLAALLPRTLQLREGVQIDTGQLDFNVASQSTGQGYIWQARAMINDVAGSDGRQQIRWQQPVEAAVRLQAGDSGSQLEQLILNSTFATARLETEQEVVRGEFEVNLAQFSQELSQFVDIRPWELRGLGEGTFALSKQPNQQFTAQANVDLTDLQVSQGREMLWSEPKLRVSVEATGVEQDFSPQRLATGKLAVHGARDALTVNLLEPVDLRAQRPPWNLQVEGNGPLASWANRLRPWLAGTPRRLEGDAHVQARFLVAQDTIEVSQAQGSVVQLRVESDALTMEEPRVEFAVSGRWDGARGNWVTPQLEILGHSFSLRAQDVAIALAAPSGSTARGQVTFSADLERVAAMLGWVGANSNSEVSGTWPQGTAVGRVQLSSNAEQLAANFGVKVEQLKLLQAQAAAGAVYGQPEVVWSEPSLELTGVAKYAVAADRVEFADLQVGGQTLQLQTAASIDELRTTGRVRANGLLQYDANELAKLIASYVGPEVQLQGDKQVRFQVAGALFDLGSNPTHWSQRWDILAEAGWSSAGAYGMPLGGGRLSGNLQAGELRIAPLDVAVGQGRLTMQPQVRFTPLQQLDLPKGPLLTNVSVSPEVSESMLKYVAPILAGATRAQGQFSVDLDQAQIPLRHPKTGHVQGRLGVHQLQVSPGPMMQQLITLVKQVEALSKKEQFLQAAVTRRNNKAFLTMTDRQIDFQVVEGRVYHRNLEFLVDNVPVRSYGSVGFDQTLALVIEVPFQDKWIQDEPALRSFAGQSIQLPIRGTFQKPQIDQRAVADLSKQLLRGVATQAIGDELNKQFNKLFGR